MVCRGGLPALRGLLPRCRRRRKQQHPAPSERRNENRTWKAFVKVGEGAMLRPVNAAGR
jgi:hypothetical protein